MQDQSWVEAGAVSSPIVGMYQAVVLHPLQYQVGEVKKLEVVKPGIVRAIQAVEINNARKAVEQALHKLDAAKDGSVAFY